MKRLGKVMHALIDLACEMTGGHRWSFISLNGTRWCVRCGKTRSGLWV